MTSLFISIPIIFGIIRVMRGGLGPQPPRPLMWAMPPLVVAGLTWGLEAWPLVLLSLLLSYQYNAGYSDHDSDGLVGWTDAFWDMFIRALPSVAFGLCVCGLYIFEQIDVNVWLVGGAVLLNVAANMIQPWTRQWAERLPIWKDHSNRLGGEALEGLAIGVLCVSVAF